MLRMLRITLIVFTVAAGSLVWAGAATATSERPFKGTIVGGGYAIDDPTCPLGKLTVSGGTGTASHLGLMTMASLHCTTLGPIEGGVGNLVAANGDRIEFTYNGMVDPTEFAEGARISGGAYHTITGGTGRFANATGQFHMTFIGTLHFTSPMTITWTFDGTISY